MLPYNKPGRFVRGGPLVSGHTASVLDFDFNPFHEQVGLCDRPFRLLLAAHSGVGILVLPVHRGKYLAKIYVMKYNQPPVPFGYSMLTFLLFWSLFFLHFVIHTVPQSATTRSSKQQCWRPAGCCIFSAFCQVVLCVSKT